MRPVVIPMVVLLGMASPSPLPVFAQEARELVVLGSLDIAPSPTPAAAAPATMLLPEPSSSTLDGAAVARMTGAGLLGGAVGLIGGAYLGALIAHNEDCADCLEELRGALIMGTAGEALLLPLGVHLANGSRGNYWKAALVSGGLATAGVLAMEAGHWDPPTVPIVLVAVPAAQLAASIAIEQSSD